MERIDSINPERLHWCLHDSHVSLEQLAVDVGISLSSLEAALSGSTGLTFTQLRKVGNYFGRTALFFLEDGPVDDERVRSQEFRSLLNQKVQVDSTVKKVIRLAEWQREVFVDLLNEVDPSESRSFSPPKLTGLSSSEAAEKVRAWLRLDSAKSFSDYRLAVEARGILVFRTNGYAGKWQIPKGSPILGFSLYDRSMPLIVVRKQTTEARQTFTLAHELAHVLLHKSSMIDDEFDLASHKGKEAEANKFAGFLLVPDSFLRQIDTGRRPKQVSGFDDWLSTYRIAWGVSTEMLLIRLLQSRKLEQREYDEYKQWIKSQKFPQKEGGSRGYRHREPRHILGDRYVKVVFEALNRNKISITKASKYLDNLKLSDLRELERHCASN